MKCPTCKQHVPEKPRVEIITVDGISYKRFHWKDGMTVESPCQCFGGMRLHSTTDCPWQKKRDKAAKSEAQALALIERTSA